MKHTPFIILIILSVYILAFTIPAFSQSKQPNIVFLLADDMSRNTWGTYGSVDCMTPNIDQLASEGMRFDRIYCSAAMCAPFRQELYSGRSPWRTGTLANHSKSKPETKSIAHYLEPLGYRVALTGKRHVGPSMSYPFEYISGSGKKGEDCNAFFMDSTKAFLNDCEAKNDPFCLFIASHDGHAPFTTGDRSVYNSDSLNIPPYWIDTPEFREELVKYYAEITNFDKLVGEVRSELEKRDLLKNTVLMVCSEQGTQLPFAKWTCYDNGLHTGLVVHWPDRVAAGSVANELMSIMDITPTLVELAGGTLQEDDCDGKSFLKTLDGEKQVLNDYVYGAFTNCNIIGNQDRIYPIRVIRDKSYSLFYNPNYESHTSNVTIDEAYEMLNDPSKNASKNRVVSTWVNFYRETPDVYPLIHKLHHRPEYELYDREKDPYELNNLIDKPKYKEVAKRLKIELHEKLKELGDGDPIATEKSLVKDKN